MKVFNIEARPLKGECRTVYTVLAESLVQAIENVRMLRYHNSLFYKDKRLNKFQLYRPVNKCQQ
jgi:hypothetical protein